MNYSACFDIGGTFIKFGVVSSEGKISLTGKVETPQENVHVKIPEIITKKIHFSRNIILSKISVFPLAD